MTSDVGPAMLALPPEIRLLILESAFENDIHSFAETATTPALLRTCHTLRREYADLFYSSKSIKIDAYYGDTDSWADVSGARAKQAVIEQSAFTDLTTFWSLASARRHCQHAGRVGESARKGIMTVQTNAGSRRWQWAIAV